MLSLQTVEKRVALFGLSTNNLAKSAEFGTNAFVLNCCSSFVFMS